MDHLPFFRTQGQTNNILEAKEVREGVNSLKQHQDDVISTFGQMKQDSKSNQQQNNFTKLGKFPRLSFMLHKSTSPFSYL